MSKIQLLDQGTINKIAAGEVVERPASVVKELVENAIDAGATAITVEIKDGGLKMIRITDNGSGIPKDQIETAFLRHSTSKIREAADLNSIGSLGFRGEALASIAAVSMVELITKEPGVTTGVRFEIRGGQQQSYANIGCPTGTTFVISELFYNTPARLKFLKTPSTELGVVSDLVNRLALGHPEIAFKFVSNGKAKLQTAGKNLLKDCVYSVFGKDIARNLIEITGKAEGIDLEGYIGKPHISRGNRTYENYYINGRYIKSKVIEKAIEDGFKSRLMLHRYPFVVFHLRVDPTLVDVNVHPTKMDVRFMKEKAIYALVFKAVVAGLEGRNMVLDARLETDKEVKETVEQGPEPFELNIQALSHKKNVDIEKNNVPNRAVDQGNKEVIVTKTEVPVQAKEATTIMANKQEPVVEPVEDKSLNKGAKGLAKIDLMSGSSVDILNNLKKAEPSKPYKSLSGVSERTTESVLKESARVKPAAFASAPEKPILKGEQIDLVEEGFIDPKSVKSHKVIGQLFDTYWIVALNDKYYIIDQHAAHEKVLYEKMLGRIEEQLQYGQRLLKPVVVNLSIQEFGRYESHSKLFGDLGFEVEPFGEEAVIIRSVPFIFNKVFEVSQFTEILDALADSYSEDKYSIVLDDLATMACKAAVKGNDRLSEVEYHQLIDDLLELDDPFHCPHGRPTIISMTKYELEKKFKRIV